MIMIKTQFSIHTIPTVLQYLTIFLCILSIFPLIWISPYVYPSLDDYCYTWNSLDLGYLQAQTFLYTGLNGRFTASALLTTSPLVYHHLTLYQLLPLVLILLTFLGYYYLLRELLDMPVSTRIICSLIMGTMYFTFMPEITEGLYWMAGAITYQLSIILLLFIYALILNSYQSRSQPPLFHYLSTPMLSFMLAGLNETAMAFHFAFLAGILMYKGYHTHKIDYFLLTVWIFTAIGAAIVIFSPGSAKRATAFPTNQSMLAFAEAFLYSGFLFWKWILTTPVLVLSLIYLVLPMYIPLNPILKLPSTGLTWLLFLLGIYLTTFVGFWSLGFRPPLRTVNVIFFIFLIGWCIVLLSTLQRYKHLKIKSGNAYPYVLILLFLLAGSFYTTPGNNSTRSYEQWIMGKIYDFRQDMQTRSRLLEQNTRDTLYLPPLRHNDIIIHYGDLRRDPNFWANHCYASYYGIKAVIIVDSPADDRFSSKPFRDK